MSLFFGIFWSMLISNMAKVWHRWDSKMNKVVSFRSFFLRVALNDDSRSGYPLYGNPRQQSSIHQLFKYFDCEGKPTRKKVGLKEVWPLRERNLKRLVTEHELRVCTQAQFKVNRNFLKLWILQSSSIRVQEQTHWAGNLSIKSPFKQLVSFIHSSLKRGSALGPTLPNVLMISMCKECWSWYWGSSRNDASCIFTRSSS